jgi:DNA-binding NarL/FixJ family response regulator
MKSKIKIHLADDHKMLIDGMLAVLKTNPCYEVVGYSLNGEDLLASITENQADVLIMDINMPIKDGIEVLKDYSLCNYHCKIIVLSSYDDIKLIKEVLKLGAAGYISKQSAGESIVEAIQNVMNGQEYFSESIRDKILNSFAGNPFSNHEKNHDSIYSLTEREIQILTLITQEYSGTEIGNKLSISASTVETHRKNLIKKLNVKNTIGLVKFAIMNNLINQ